MNTKPMLQSELSKMLRERYDSHEWWILVPVDADGKDMLRRIEEAYYWDEAGWDFDVALHPALQFALAKKTRMSPEQLFDICGYVGGQITLAELEGVDVVALGLAENEGFGEYASKALSYLMQ